MSHPYPRFLVPSALLVGAQFLSGCGRTVPQPVEPPIAKRSADEIIAAAKLSPEAAPRAAFEIQRLDAYAACSAAQTRFEGRARASLEVKGSGSGGILGGVVIGGLGLVGGVVTTALAASLKAPPVPSVPDPNVEVEPPGVEGKTGVIVAGVISGVAVVGAAVTVVALLASGGDDDDDDGKKKATEASAQGTGAAGNAKPPSTQAELTAKIGAFQSECPDDPPDSALQACIDKARVLRLSCSAGR